MDHDLVNAQNRLSKLEAETVGATEQQLAAAHRKILHELRRDWLTTVCKSVIVTLTTALASAALINKKPKPAPKS